MSDFEDAPSLLSRLIDTEQTGSAEHSVIISERACALVQVKALGGKRTQLRAGLKKLLGEIAPNKPLHATVTETLTIAAVGPEEFWCLAPGREAEEFNDQVTKAVGQLGAVFQHSDARRVLTLSGTAAETVLSSGCAVDFDASAFPVPGGCLTVIEMIPVLIVKRDTVPTFDIAVPNSYAESFLDWLLVAAQDFGYRIDQS